MDKVMEILKEVNNQIDYEKEKDLINSGIFSSFDILFCISLIEEKFHIEVPADEISNANFSSADNILSMINRIQERN